MGYRINDSEILNLRPKKEKIRKMKKQNYNQKYLNPVVKGFSERKLQKDIRRNHWIKDGRMVPSSQIKK